MRSIGKFLRQWLACVTVAVTATTSLALTPATAQAASARLASQPAASKAPKLPASKQDGVPRGIMWMRGHVPAQRMATPGVSGPTASEMSYGGGTSVPPGMPGVIEGKPRVYIVYWGNQWGQASHDSNGDWTFSGDPDGLAPYQQEFFKGLGTNNEKWSGVLTQYCDGVTVGAKTCPTSNAEHVGYPTGGGLAGVWYDGSAAVPNNATSAQIEAEAVAAAVHFGNNSADANLNNQYVITFPHGTDPDNYETANECAWHSDTINVSWTPDDVTYTMMPYLPDVGTNCGVGAVNDNCGSQKISPCPLDGVSIVGGHEYAETLTDAYVGSGWYGNSDSTDETGDKCEWGANGSSLGTVTLATGTFPMQPTWDNSANSGKGACSLGHAIITDPPSGSGSSIMIVGDSISNGMLGDYTWRYRLWQELKASGAGVKFVGHRTGTEDIYDDPGDLATVDGLTGPSDNYADPTDGYYSSSIPSGSFPGPGASSHDALWGWSFSEADKYISQDASTYKPAYLLIELGFNDLAFLNTPSGTLANAQTLINNARAVDPSVKVLIANVVTRTPLCGFPDLNSNIATYNSDLAAAVPGWSTAKSPVHFVDISSGYDPTTMTYDGLHPNGDGEYEIADAFAAALANDYGVGKVPGSPPSVPPITMTTPASLDASISSKGVLLQWSRVYAASGYKIFERDITGNPSPLPAFTELPLPLPGDHWYAGWGTAGHTYQYEVAAARGNTESTPSSPVSITMPATEPTPDAPVNVTSTPSAGTTSIALSWSAPSGSPNDSSITGYNVLWEDADSGCPDQIANETFTTGTSYTLTGLIPGHLYYLALSSVNASGTGAETGAPAAIVGDGAPAAPVISAGPNSTLTWSAVPGATGYWIYSANPFTPPNPPTWTRLIYEVPLGWNGSLTAGLYEMTAANGSLESPMSNAVQLSGTPPAAKPSSVRGAGAISPAAWIPGWLRAAPNAGLVRVWSEHA
jgi:lysophospholipase L1-like esterase